MSSPTPESTMQRSQNRRWARLAVLSAPVVILAVGGVVLAVSAGDEASPRAAAQPVAGDAGAAAQPAARQGASAGQESTGAGALDPVLDPDWLEGSPAHRAKADALMGKPAPQLDVDSWMNSNPLTLDDLKGKAVLLFFWSPTCHTCQQIMPYLNESYKRAQAAKQPVEFIGVCTTNQAPLYAQGVEHHGIPFPAALDHNNATWGAYHADGTPDFYVIDKEGVLRAADVKNKFSLMALGAILKESEPASEGG